MPRECALKLVEIAPGKRGRNADVGRILRDEALYDIANQQPTAIEKAAHAARDAHRVTWSTASLSTLTMRSMCSSWPMNES